MAMKPTEEEPHYEQLPVDVDPNQLRIMASTADEINRPLLTNIFQASSLHSTNAFL